VWLIRELRSWYKLGVSQAGSVGTPRQEWGRQGAELTLSMSNVLRPHGVLQDSVGDFCLPCKLGAQAFGTAITSQPALRHYRKHTSFWQDDLLSWDHSQISPHPQYTHDLS